MSPSDIPTPADAEPVAGDASLDSGNAGPDVAATPDEELELLEATPVSVAPDPVAELAQVRDRWLRTEADLQNYRRRAQRDVEEARRNAEERAIVEQIEVLDDLDRALSAAREAGAASAWVQGVDLVAQRLRDSLTRAGVIAVNPVGEAFDPRFHEALIELPAPPDAAPGTILHVERTGYRRGERMLRAARVAVAADRPAEA